MNEISIMKYDDSYEQIWDEFILTSKTPLFMYCRSYMEYHKDRFRDHSLMFFNKDQIISLLPANIINDCLFSHGGLTYGGFIFKDSVKQHTVNDCIDKLIVYSKENGIHKILYKPIPHIYHVQPAEEDLYGIFQKGAILSEVSASTVMNLKNMIKMQKGRKAQISRAKREGVIVELLDTKEDYKTFMSLENEILEQYHGVRTVHSAEEMHLLHRRFPKNIHLFGALLDKDLIAGTIVYEYPNLIHTQYMASNDTGRKIGALDLTINEVINRFKESKTWLDFGISTENHGTYLNEGLISQKEGFGGRTNITTTWMINT